MLGYLLFLLHKPTRKQNQHPEEQSNEEEQWETTRDSQNAKAAANNVSLTLADVDWKAFSSTFRRPSHHWTTRSNNSAHGSGDQNDCLRIYLLSAGQRQRYPQTENSICIISLPEKAEGQQPSSFTETLLKELLSAEAFHTPLTLDHAHRITTSRKKQDETSRPFIVRIHHQPDQGVHHEVGKRGQVSVLAWLQNTHFPWLQRWSFQEKSRKLRGEIAAIERRVPI